MTSAIRDSIPGSLTWIQVLYAVETVARIARQLDDWQPRGPDGDADAGP